MSPRDEEDQSARLGGPNGLEVATAKQEKLHFRLEAEASIGVSAALIGGFALSLIVEAKEFERELSKWLFVIAMGFGGSLCLFSVVVSASVYWVGKHLLSASLSTVKGENDLFRKWWKTRMSRFARKGARHAFEFSIPLFLFGICVLTYEVTDGNHIIVMVLAALFLLLLLAAIPITRGMENYLLTATATA
mmetsp:Transcript_46312/g.130946  ORF Transcript_46312/g.130946 Transcript_46312/m.130946 type:complete len:191 (+) Transcript_46312:109-681(+)